MSENEHPEWSGPIPLGYGTVLSPGRSRHRSPLVCRMGVGCGGSGTYTRAVRATLLILRCVVICGMAGITALSLWVCGSVLQTSDGLMDRIGALLMTTITLVCAVGFLRDISR